MSRLRHLIAGSALLFAVALIGIAATLLTLDYFDTREQAERAASDWASILDQYTRRTFETGDLVADQIIEETRARGGTRNLPGDAKFQQQLVNLSERTTGDYLMVVDSAGKVMSLMNAPATPAVDLSDREWFRAHARDGRERYIGPAIVSRITNEPLFTYSRRILDGEGRFDGAFQISLRESFFTNVPMEGLAQNSVFAIWTKDGRLVGRAGMTRELAESNFRSTILAEARARQPFGVLEASSAIDGINRIIAYRTLEPWNIVVTAAIPRDSMFVAWRRLTTATATLTGLVLLMLFMATWGMLVLGRREEQMLATISASNHQLEASNTRLTDANATKEVLLREIHHRVKNNLQVTASLLRMQGRHFKDPDLRNAIERTDERLQAMSLLHETIYRSDFTGFIPLDDYIARIAHALAVANAAEDRGIGIATTANKVEITPDQAMPLGLIVAEIVSNCFKHAFPAGRKGEISIASPSSDGRLHLSISDNGVGTTDAPGAGSLGLKLIATFARQLDATYTFESGDAGTKFDLFFDLRKVGGEGGDKKTRQTA